MYCSGQDGPCYRCLFPEPPPVQARGTCADDGVIGPLVGAMGALQALEAVKILMGIGETLSARLLLVDGLTQKQRVAKLRSRRPDCAACGHNKKIPLSIVEDAVCKIERDDALELSAVECSNLIAKQQAILIDVKKERKMQFFFLFIYLFKGS